MSKNTEKCHNFRESKLMSFGFGLLDKTSKENSIYNHIKQKNSVAFWLENDFEQSILYSVNLLKIYLICLRLVCITQSSFCHIKKTNSV